RKFESNSGLAKLADSESNGAQTRAVLAANTRKPNFVYKINLPIFFRSNTQFLESVTIQKGLTVEGLATLKGGIKTDDKDINAGKGKITASNVVYGLT